MIYQCPNCDDWAQHLFFCGRCGARAEVVDQSLDPFDPDETETAPEVDEAPEAEE